MSSYGLYHHPQMPHQMNQFKFQGNFFPGLDEGLLARAEAMGVVDMGKASHGGSQLMKPEGLYGHTPEFTPMAPHPHPSGPPSRQMGSHMGHHSHVHHPGFGPGAESMFEPLTPSNAPGMPPLGPVASMADHLTPHHVSNISSGVSSSAVSSVPSSSVAASVLGGGGGGHHHAASPHSPGGVNNNGGGGGVSGHPPPPHPHQMYTPMYSAAPVNPHHPHHHPHHPHHPHHLTAANHPAATMHHPHHPHHHHHHHHHHPGLVGMHGLGAPGAAGGVVAGLGAGSESDCDPRELEMFAERFKQRRIKLGVTQADVGSALANLKIPGVGCLSQSTICRFESLTLSHNNMIALKPILMAWLEDAERQARERKADPSAEEKKRKRTSIAAPEKRSLEAYFAVQPRPSGEKIAQIAEKLDLKKNVVRVWFCNQRQKQKRMKFSASAMGHH